MLAALVTLALSLNVHGAFKTPSGNIVCGYSYGSGFPASIECGIKSGLKPPPRPPKGGCTDGDYTNKRVSLTRIGSPRPVVCAGDPGPFVDEQHAKVLGYGKVWQGGGLWCISQPAGLTCGNAAGHGFFISRQRWRRF